MPNNITNIVTPIGDAEKIWEMFNNIKNDKFGVGTIDFNKIIPMPEELNIESGSITDKGLKMYSGFVEQIQKNNPLADALNIASKIESAYINKIKNVDKMAWDLGKQAFLNIQKYGYPTWYEWCIEKWGTKWNAYGYSEGEDYSQNSELCFQTAWSAPHNIIQELSKIYPDIIFEHNWADEDIGYNCGKRVYSEGVLSDEYIPNMGVRSFDFAADILGTDPEEYGYLLNKTGTEYIDINAKEYDVVEIMGITGLFANERMHSSEIPKIMFKYDLRYDDDGEKFACIENHVTVNHGGTFLTK